MEGGLLPGVRSPQSIEFQQSNKRVRIAQFNSPAVSSKFDVRPDLAPVSLTLMLTSGLRNFLDFFQPRLRKFFAEVPFKPIF